MVFPVIGTRGSIPAVGARTPERPHTAPAGARGQAGFPRKPWKTLWNIPRREKENRRKDHVNFL
jgi:hypothetical protein